MEFSHLYMFSMLNVRCKFLKLNLLTITCKFLSSKVTVKTVTKFNNKAAYQPLCGIAHFYDTTKGGYTSPLFLQPHLSGIPCASWINFRHNLGSMRQNCFNVPYGMKKIVRPSWPAWS